MKTAGAYTMRSFDMAVPRVAGTVPPFDVAATELHIRKVGSPFTLRFNGGEPITFTAPEIFKTLDCTDIGSVDITNAAGSGVVELYWSRSIAPAGKADAAASTAARTNIAVIAAGTNINLVEMISGQVAGQNKFAAQNVAAAEAPTLQGAPLFALGTRIGAIAQQVGKLVVNYGIQVPTLFNNVAPAHNGDALNGQKLVFEAEFFIERTAIAAGRHWGHFGIGAEGGSTLLPNVMGFVYHYGPGGNAGFTNENLRWAAYVGSQTGGNWKDLKTAPNGNHGGMYNTDLGIPAVGKKYLLRTELYFVGGVINYVGFVDGIEVARQVGGWPNMDAATRATVGPWFPEIRGVHETTGTEENKVFTNIERPAVRFWIEG